MHGLISFQTLQQMTYMTSVKSVVECQVLKMPIKTKGGAVTMQDVSELVRQYFTPESVISIDCSATGPNSWITDTIAAAGRNDKAG